MRCARRSRKRRNSSGFEQPSAFEDRTRHALSAPANGPASAIMMASRTVASLSRSRRARRSATRLFAAFRAEHLGRERDALPTTRDRAMPDALERARATARDRAPRARASRPRRSRDRARATSPASARSPSRPSAATGRARDRRVLPRDEARADLERALAVGLGERGRRGRDDLRVATRESIKTESALRVTEHAERADRRELDVALFVGERRRDGVARVVPADRGERFDGGATRARVTLAERALQVLGRRRRRPAQRGRAARSPRRSSSDRSTSARTPRARPPGGARASCSIASAAERGARPRSLDARIARRSMSSPSPSAPSTCAAAAATSSDS